MSLHDELTQQIREKVDILAERGCVEELCLVCALCLTLGDVDTINYIGDRYAHLFNEEQQAAFASIRTRTPEIKAAEAMIESDNPLIDHLAQLNRTVQ